MSIFESVKEIFIRILLFIYYFVCCTQFGVAHSQSFSASFSTQETLKDAEDCSVDAPLAPGAFWQTTRRIQPLGLTRLLVSIGFNGYDLLMKMLPKDIQGMYTLQTARVSGY